MKFKVFNMAIAALSLVAASTVAAAQPTATPLTQPAPERVSGDNQFAGGAGFIILIFAVVAVGLGIYAGVDGDDEPNSPG